ncbi:tripartite tricarboxylate transporter permease [Virgibacillus sp. JSM 102003]|uniref:tripartite tricarboxylate transporter permease n=1 Tax=Virgibacillus sp. JSM 102003 TaxID=1562108 RepID=UPI0035BFBC14
MDIFQLLYEGFLSALSFENLLAAAIGALLGTVVGILPGLGASATIAIMIPVAFTMPAESGLIMMIAVYYGAMYGASTTAILLKMPGAPSAVVSTLDGYPLAQQGKAGPAISITAIGSFYGSIISLLGVMFLTIPLSTFALRFGPVEYTSVMVFALLMAATLIGSSILKGLFSIGIGVAISLIGMDLQTGVSRFTLGIDHLLSGIDMIVVIIGIFGIGEVFYYLVTQRKGGKSGERLALRGSLIPSKKDFKESIPPFFRGSIIGFLSGLLPGSGSTIASFLSYSTEKRLSKTPERFGKGAMQGLASVDTANNASVGGALVPMFSLGIPGSGTTAVLLGALMMYGVSPGPSFIVNEAELFWTIVASAFLANIVLIILNLPLIPLFVKVLDIPTKYLMPIVLVIAFTGCYSLNGSITDIWLVFVFGIIGFFMRVGGLSPALFVLAIVLGVDFERYFRQALITASGDLTVFITSPISLILLLVATTVVTLDIVKTYRQKRKVS